MGRLITNRYINPTIDSTYLYDMTLQWGATLAGFGDVSCGLASELRHMPRAVSLAVKHPKMADSLVTKDDVVAYTNQFSEIDDSLEKIQKKLVTYLRLQGWRALAIPPDSDRRDVRFIARIYPLFQHKTAATCAGLGWVGKNGLLVNRRYGARLSWATVLTDAPLQLSSPYQKGMCGACNRCVEACPSGAVTPDEWVRGETVEAKVDVKACARQLEKNYKVIGSYICGLCITACPLSRK